MKMNLYAPLLAVALVAAACGDGESVSFESAGDSLPADSTTTVSTVATVAPTATDTDAGPLYLGLSIHVEGWSDEASNSEMFDRHVAGLLLMAEVAADHGAVFTFELSDVFMDAVVQWNSDVIDRLSAFGQGTGIHADIGGRGNPGLAGLVAPLVQMRAKAESIGVDTRHVSGICSPGPWVEAALEAGFQSTNGAVQYCATSLDPDLVPDSWDLSGCSTPAACHGQLQVDLESKIHPYLVDSSADFISASETGLVLMIGNSGEAVDCAAELETGGRCVGEPADLPHVEAVLEEYLEERDPSQVAALTMSWSVGSIPSEAFIESIVMVFDEAVSSGEAVWAANGDIGQAALDALSP